MEEIAMNSVNDKVDISYYISDKKRSLRKIQEGFFKKLSGYVEAEFESHDYQYSEYTGGTDYNTIFNISGHNLYNELMSNQDKYLTLIVKFELITGLF
jgi:hypothetical protein